MLAIALCRYGGCIKRHERANAFNLVVLCCMLVFVLCRLLLYSALFTAIKLHLLRGRAGQILTVETLSVPNLHSRLDGRVTRWSESVDDDTPYAFAIRVFHSRCLDVASRHFNEHALIGQFSKYFNPLLCSYFVFLCFCVLFRPGDGSPSATNVVVVVDLLGVVIRISIA